MRTNTAIYKHGICPKIYTAGFSGYKILHHQFHLILTVLVGKTQKMRENGEIYTAGKSFTLNRMDIFAKRFAQSSFSFGKRPFRVKVSGEWLSTGNGKEYFRLGALRAVDWPSTPQTIWPAGEGGHCTIS